MEKRESCRAIVFNYSQMLVMYREKNDRIYYTFPGGGKQSNETKEECVCREVLEEFGIIVEPLREIYLYENQTSVQYFYLCKWISGQMGTGQGEEFQGNLNKGVYVPMFLDTEKFADMPLMPPEVKVQLIEDIKKFGYNLETQIKRIKGD